jgi:DNA-binding transcriptional ArsR family regulator
MPTAELGVDQRLVKAIGHPIRMRALTLLNERVASPSEISKELKEPLGVVAYHVRILEELECIELVRTEPRRGALEHYYRALRRPWLDDEQVKHIPASLRRSLAGSVFAQLTDDVAAAGRGEGLDRDNHWMARTPLVLDETAWEELGQMLQTVLDRALELQAESIGRLLKEQDPESISAVLAQMLFERHLPEHDRAKRSAEAERSPKPRNKPRRAAR